MEKHLRDTETACDEPCMTDPDALGLMRAVILEWCAGNTTGDDTMRAVGTILRSLAGFPSSKSDPSDFS